MIQRLQSETNHISVVMARMLTSSAVDCRVKPKAIKLLFVASLLSIQHKGERAKTSWLGMRIKYRVELHVYQRTVVSVSLHYENPAKRVGLV
jgi:hypothetical protein